MNATPPNPRERPPELKLRHVPENLVMFGVTPEEYAAYREFMRLKREAGGSYGIDQFASAFPELAPGARAVAGAYQRRTYMKRRGYTSVSEIGPRRPPPPRLGAGQQAILDTLAEAGVPLTWSQIMDGARLRCDKSDSSLGNSLSTHLLKRGLVVRVHRGTPPHDPSTYALAEAE